MIHAHSVTSVRAAEAAAMAELPDGELMRRAAQGLAEVAAARLDDCEGSTAVALIGGGDNGGDALYAAALLIEAGFACAAVLVPENGREGVHRGALEEAERQGVNIVVAADDDDEDTGHATESLALVAEADLVLDGIVGIGGHPGLRTRASALVDAIDDDAWVIAVDLASGLDPAGEVAADDTVWADETVTFGTPKPVHLLPAGEPASGRLTVIDIGVDFSERQAAVERLVWDDVAALWPVPGPSDDKYSRGVLGVVAGGESYAGAAVLCVTAALEAGVGMVRYVGTPTPTGLVRAAAPEAVIGSGQVQAWVLGPGFDPDADGEQAHSQFRAAHDALASELPVVVDAGALGLLDGTRTAVTLITPHAGEAATLLSRLGSVEVTRADVEAGPLEHARELAALTNATVLLKGSTTLVVSPDEKPVRSQADATPWLATAGSGDVLAGVVGALLASGLSAADAGSLGALVHGVAGNRVSGGGPVRALALAHGIRPTVAHLLVRAGSTGH
ncbi:MAG: bifunctional ADP-dependent NAD(P)H-hydrate dehydratase/NAD(P)H-hydrate epimerase [Humibacillus sp.]|nr:bifunctional ADP-dependent NAD(P)H-hydrate dehydratase/NAD(P)H-hydrate epimerase [Humibacillus sp.]MDN5778942.1 bifunctional ADP-dependent NAD(P)H-hydrate dehydratase/NAD(P)H-hydrate epimerase [Humibacillus sp.]